MSSPLLPPRRYVFPWRGRINFNQIDPTREYENIFILGPSTTWGSKVHRSIQSSFHPPGAVK
jgi:hypothetical protein